MKLVSLRFGMLMALLALPLARGAGPDYDRSVPPAAEFFLRVDAVDWRAVLPPPPAPGSIAALADLETVLRVQAARTPADVAWAKRVAQDDVWADYGEVLGAWFEPRNLPGVHALLRHVTGDAQAVNRKLKDLYGRVRPFNLEPTVNPCVDRPVTNSYPSGHSLRAFVWAGVLSDIFPDYQAKLHEQAHRIAWGRVQGGAHFPSDTVAGRVTAQTILSELRKSPAYRAAIEQCRAEGAPFVQKKAA